eukprot:scaffold10567_cov180-Chaetoceros_neogracile.AAC.1
MWCVSIPRSVQNAYIDSAFTADFTVAHPGNAAFHTRGRGFSYPGARLLPSLKTHGYFWRFN